MAAHTYTVCILSRRDWLVRKLCCCETHKRARSPGPEDEGPLQTLVFSAGFFSDVRPVIPVNI